MHGRSARLNSSLLHQKAQEIARVRTSADDIIFSERSLVVNIRMGGIINGIRTEQRIHNSINLSWTAMQLQFVKTTA